MGRNDKPMAVSAINSLLHKLGGKAPERRLAILK